MVVRGLREGPHAVDEREGLGQVLEPPRALDRGFPTRPARDLREAMHDLSLREELAGHEDRPGRSKAVAGMKLTHSVNLESGCPSEDAATSAHNHNRRLGDDVRGPGDVEVDLQGVRVVGEGPAVARGD